MPGVLKVKLKLPPATGPPELNRAVSDMTSWVPIQAQVTLVPTVTVSCTGDQLKARSVIMAGAGLGVAVGLTVRVGLAEGVAVAVPVMVPVAEGDPLGVADGDAEGLAVWVAEGDPVGVTDGDEDGVAVSVGVAVRQSATLTAFDEMMPPVRVTPVWLSTPEGWAK